MSRHHRLRVVTESVDLDGRAWVLLRAHGNSMGAGAEVLKSALDSCTWEPACRVLIRFEDATVVDSMTIGVLVQAAARVTARGGRLKVWVPPDLARRWYGFGDEDWGTGIPGVLPKRPGPTQATDAKPPEGEAG
jgi:hypothetical protein